MGGTVSSPGGIPPGDWALAQKWGQSYGVDPLLLVAIGMHETGWGTLGDGRPPPQGHGNVLGVGSFDAGSVSTWSGLEAQLREGAKILADHGVHSIDDVRAGKARWWATDPEWAKGVSDAYDKIKGGAGNFLNNVGSAVGGALSFPSQVNDFFRALEKPLQALMWLFNPTNWARMIAGALGVLLLIGGLVTLGKAA